MSVRNSIFERKPYMSRKALMSILSASAYTKNAFPEWILEYCTRATRVLDVGAGKDRNQIDAAIQPCVVRIVGVDPSEDILFNSSVHEHYHGSLENFARETHEQFDILFCTMVLEHITNPDTFFSACRQLLKPGGMFFAITPNMWHYFGLATKITSILNINEWLLDRLIGREAKEAYHFPTFYKVNSLSAIQKVLTRTGFQDVEFRCFDNWIEYRYVFPRRLHWFPKLYSRLVYRFKLHSLMGRIMFRAMVT
jgi:2-polyprenyl-3-methyl-5-hydroxy-6-metoxy-1,4-benzoquinol methylase